MNTPPTVSIGIATLGRREIVKNTIHEVLRQTTMPQAIIVVEQDAPYDVSDVEELCARQGVRCIYVFSRYRSTPCARNYAISLCESDIIIFVDDDVEILTDIVREHADIHEKEPGAVAAGGLLTCYPKSVSHVYANSFFPTTRYLSRVKGGNMSFKVAAIRRMRGFNDFITMMAEEADCIRWLQRRHHALIANCPDAIVLHLAHKSGGTRQAAGTADAERKRNDTGSRDWWRTYVRDNVVSFSSTFGILLCALWFIARANSWRRAVTSGPSARKGLIDLFAEFGTGIRLQRHAVRIHDHIAYSRTLATNTAGISCPLDYLSKWRLLDDATRNDAPPDPDSPPCTVLVPGK